MEELLHKRTYGTILKESKTKQEYLSNIEEAFPRDAALCYERLEAYAEVKFGDKEPVYASPFTPEDFPNTPNEMNTWSNEQLSMPRLNPMVKHI